MVVFVLDDDDDCGKSRNVAVTSSSRFVPRFIVAVVVAGEWEGADNNSGLTAANGTMASVMIIPMESRTYSSIVLSSASDNDDMAEEGEGVQTVFTSTNGGGLSSSSVS